MMMMFCYDNNDRKGHHFERSHQRFQIKNLFRRSEKSDVKNSHAEQSSADFSLRRKSR
jgi:hypothetical protein